MVWGGQREKEGRREGGEEDGGGEGRERGVVWSTLCEERHRPLVALHPLCLSLLGRRGAYMPVI